MANTKPRFERTLSRFADRLVALDELADAVAPQLEELRRKPAWTNSVREGLRALDSSRRRQAQEILDLLPDLFFPFMAGKRERAEEIASRVRDVTASFRIEVGHDGMQILTDDRELAKPLIAFIDGMKKMTSSPSHAALLRRSLLTMAVGAFEDLMGDLLREHLLLHENAFRSDEKEFSLADLLSYGSMQEAVNSLVDRRVDDFTRKGIEEWSRWFGGRSLKISLEDACSDWDRTREVYERRNLVVHHDCRVSSQYLSKVPAGLTQDISVGGTLSVTEAYLRKAIGLLLQAGLLLGLRIWVKLTKQSEEAASWMIDRQLEFIRNGRAEVALHLGSSLDVTGLTDTTQLITRVNCWISRKQLEGLDAIREEVSDWDTDALSPLFRVAKSALLEQHDDAAAGVSRLLDANELDIVDLRDWPLFEPLRSSGLVDDALALPEGDGALTPQLMGDAQEIPVEVQVKETLESPTDETQS